VADGNFNRCLAWSERRRASGIRSRLPWIEAQDDAQVQLASDWFYSQAPELWSPFTQVLYSTVLELCVLVRSVCVLC
jgi:hypothetical protein